MLLFVTSIQNIFFRFCHSIFISRSVFLVKCHVRRHCVDIQVNKNYNVLSVQFTKQLINLFYFSGFRLLLYSNKIENEKKKYTIYSIYAWGCSIGITILTALAEFTDLLTDSSYKPNIGYNNCWFSSK